MLHSWWKYAARPRLGQLGEKVLTGIVWRLPRPLVYWSAIRLGAHATQGQYSNTVVPELTFMDALKRWGGN